MKIVTIFAFAASLSLVSANHKPYKKFLKKTDFVFVPSGSVQSVDKSKSINAFLMLNHEVTNLEYREFIQSKYLSVGDKAGAKAALPDTSAWEIDSTKGYMTPLVNTYYSHPAYNNYPVVNVSKKNAEKYCVWLTETLRKNYPESTFNNFRLPTSSEWTYAARGGLKNSPYPWGGPFTRNSKGCYLANFNVVGEENITKTKNDNRTVVNTEGMKVKGSQNNEWYGPAKIKTYTANGYGLYNMAGNVAEMIAEDNKAMGGHWLSYGNDIQVTSAIDFEKANPMVGFRPIASY